MVMKCQLFPPLQEVGKWPNFVFTFDTAGSIATVQGGADSDTLTGASQANAFAVTGINAGTLNGATSFTDVEVL